MSIIRTEHNKNNPYVIINKSALEDKELSWSAKGLWSYLISRPDDWHVSVAHLSTIYNDKGGGEKAIYTILNELIDKGYCTRKQETGDKGQFGKYDYTIFEFKNKVPNSLLADAAEPRAAQGSLTNNRCLLSKETTTTPVVVVASYDKEGDIKRNALQKSNLPLSQGIIESSLLHSLSDIQNAIEHCLNRIESIKDIDAYFHEALAKKWQPKPSKEKLEQLKKEKQLLQEEQQQKEQENAEIQRLKEERKIFVQAKQLEIACQNKMNESFKFSVKEHGIFMSEDIKGYSKKVMTTNQLNQNSLDKLKNYINNYTK